MYGLSWSHSRSRTILLHYVVFVGIDLLILGATVLGTNRVIGQEQAVIAQGELTAGAYAKNIDPKVLPVWVNGGISGRKIDRITDSLHARSLVLSDGRTSIAICIVDNCILPIELVDKAKERILLKTGIDRSHVMIAATHTHSAVSVSGAHGTPVQEDYADELPEWIAESVAAAKERMVKAKWGTTSVLCDQFIYCRDWLMKPGTAQSSPFSGRLYDHAMMNPGHDNANKIAPVGTIDMLMPILSIQDLDGKPISLLATFCTHYAGSANISSDYFGVVAQRLAITLRPEAPDAFVGIMSNSTSGNANCIDFSKPRQPFTHHDVGEYVSKQILSVVPSIEYSNTISIDAELNSIDLPVRMPSSEEVAVAKKYIESHFPDRLPVTMDENYARETVLLSEMPETRKLNLQGFRLNDFLITANPCEAYNETGLKIRQASPFRLTMNVGLANGHAGYIPPPEMFQLGGYTTWRARSSCLEEQAEPKMVNGLVEVMQTLDQRRKKNSTAQSITPQSPISPKESLKQFVHDTGFQLELVASEPQIVDPVSMQIDRHGRIWVVQMGDYPNHDGNANSQIVVLEDKDLDGFFETSHLFADGLTFATGVQPWENGALVTTQGQLLMLRDRDGDLKVDSKETWLEGFAVENPQLRANHPTIGPDGWLYIASGLRGGKIKQSIPFAKPTSEILDLTSGDLRVNLFTGQVEVIGGPSQYGLTFDRLGNRYGCSNRQPCFEIVSERRLINQSPLAGLEKAFTEVSPGEAQSSVHPLVNAWTTSNLHAGQFTAACGVLVTHSQHFPGDHFANILTCEPTGSLVQHRKANRKSGIAKIYPELSEQEWLASKDPWFRPVDLYEGPNGDIYIVDMYRAVIEHPEWVPTELKNRPDQRSGDSLGRIYRMKSRRDTHSQEISTNVHSGSTWEEQIASPLQWNRSVALQILFDEYHRAQESGNDQDRREVIERLRRITSFSIQERNVSAVASLVLLQSSMGQYDLPSIQALLSSADDDIRMTAWKSLLELDPKNVSPELSDFLIGRLQKTFKQVNTSVEELRAAAWFIAKLPASQVKRFNLIESMAESLVRHDSDGHLWMAVSAASQSNLDDLIESYLNLKTSVSNDGMPFSSMANEALTRLTAKVFLAVSTAERSLWMSRSMDQLQDARPIVCKVAMAVLDGFKRSGKLQIAPGSKDDQRVIELARNSSDPAIRTAAVGLLSCCSSDTAKSVAVNLLESDDIVILKKAIEACSSHKTEAFDDWLFKNFCSSLPEVRPAIFTAIRNSPNRISAMIERIESGDFSTKQLDASQIQSLKSVTDKELSSRLQKIFNQAIDPNRLKVVDSYSSVISTTEVNPKQNRGKAVFDKNCAACHRLNNIGTTVGPDISDARDQTVEKLIVSILDPNRSIDANYFRYQVRTEDGISLDGVLKDANSQTVTLSNQNGVRTIDRSTIAEMKSMGVSLMPDGIESQISPSEMAELVWYIKNWRYVNDNVPASTTVRP